MHQTRSWRLFIITKLNINYSFTRSEEQVSCIILTILRSHWVYDLCSCTARENHSRHLLSIDIEGNMWYLYIPFLKFKEIKQYSGLSLLISSVGKWFVKVNWSILGKPGKKRRSFADSRILKDTAYTEYTFRLKLLVIWIEILNKMRESILWHCLDPINCRNNGTFNIIFLNRATCLTQTWRNAV